MTSFATHAIADSGAVYVAGALGPVPTMWRLGVADGKPAWSYDSRTHASAADGPPSPAGACTSSTTASTWPTRRPAWATGEAFDAWGESVSDGEHLFAENDWYLDGYGLYLSAFNMNIKLLWRRDYNALARGVMVPDVGGLAYGGGLLVHAAQHGPLTGSGLSAFDPSTSERRWRVVTSPLSSPSLAGGRVSVVERWPGEKTDRLVSRQADGTLVCSTPSRRRERSGAGARGSPHSGARERGRRRLRADDRRAGVDGAAAEDRGRDASRRRRSPLRWGRARSW